MNSRIVVDSNKFHGSPIITGTCIPIYLIVDLVADGVSFEEIILDYPSITEEDIKACLKYAAEFVNYKYRNCITKK